MSSGSNDCQNRFDHPINPKILGKCLCRQSEMMRLIRGLPLHSSLWLLLWKYRVAGRSQSADEDKDDVEGAAPSSSPLEVNIVVSLQAVLLLSQAPLQTLAPIHYLNSSCIASI
ncbi:Uncharacterized protein Adt_23280 [Abeliophyllum distichum]|uniref:Uncharacterized protein n=1 Tax=Abeliophyllum distichum TaxID=126358 RepID=A0ABD1SAW2_9LAMI